MPATATKPLFEKLTPLQRDLAYKKAAAHIRQVEEESTKQLEQLLLRIKRAEQHAALVNSIVPAAHAFLVPKRYKGAHGGRGSGKSQSFARMLVAKALKTPGLRAVCVREVQKSLEQSVKRLIEDVLTEFNLGDRFRVLNTHIETPGDGIIIFQGMQNHTAESIKSLEGYDLAWVEEAQSLSERSLTLLRPTIRKEQSELWFTWNPRYASDPIDKFLRVTPPPDSIVVEMNFSDNPYLPAELRAELEWDKRRDPDKYQHIWLGGYERHSEARVFKNWRIEEFSTPEGVEFLFGGDWGFAVDPTVLIRCFVNTETRRLWVDEEVYQVGCEIDDTPALFDKIGEREGKAKMARDWHIVADSARPETISYLQRHGYPKLVPAKKGQGSVEDGIQFLKNYDIIVHPRCTHTIDELTMYSYKKNPLTDEILPVLEDKKNHVIDSLRYAVETLRLSLGEDYVVW